MSRKQIELAYYIGYPVEHSGFERAVLTAASNLCGGCYKGFGRGYWVDGKDRQRDQFDGVAHYEHCLHIVLTCEKKKEKYVVAAMQEQIKIFVDAFSIDTTWVHVQRSKITGLHFNAQEN